LQQALADRGGDAISLFAARKPEEERI